MNYPAIALYIAATILLIGAFRCYRACRIDPLYFVGTIYFGGFGLVGLLIATIHLLRHA